MKNLTHFFLATVFCLLSTIGLCQKKMTDSATFFKVDNFYCFNSDGDWMKYHIAGFYCSGTNDNMNISLLPNISFNIQNIRFLTADDKPVLTDNFKITTRIEIPFLYSTIFPNNSQSIGIVSQIKGKPMNRYVPDASRTLEHLPNISRQYKNHPMISQAVMSFYSALEQRRHEQNNYLKSWLNYHVEDVKIFELAVTLLIDGKAIATQSIYTNSKEGTYILSILNPTTQVCRNLKEGEFKVSLDYRFKDPILEQNSGAAERQKSIKVFIDGERNNNYKPDLGIIGFLYNPAIFNTYQPCVLVTAMTERSPLLLAGIAPGEIIWKINDTVVSSPADMDKTLSNFSPGQNINVTLIDLNRNTITKTVTLGRSPVSE